MILHSGWSMIPSPVAVEPFTAAVGPQVPTNRDPLDMFSNFFDESLLSEIVHQTILYAAQCLSAANSHTTWETSVAYVGHVCICMYVHVYMNACTHTHTYTGMSTMKQYLPM